MATSSASNRSRMHMRGLTAAAAADPLWDVAERCALGESDNWAEINIAGNSYSSSLLPMLDLHREAAPQSVYQGTEPCRVITLDSYIERTFADPTTLFGLKIDTQGYEAHVLAGLRRNHQRVKAIVCEMSLAPALRRWTQHVRAMPACWQSSAIAAWRWARNSKIRRTGELLQANGVFVKRWLTPNGAQFKKPRRCALPFKILFPNVPQSCRG